MTFEQWLNEFIRDTQVVVDAPSRELMSIVWSEAQKNRPEGEVVVTKNPRGEIVLVSRQNEEGQILSVIAEPGFTESQLKTLEDANSILNVRGNKETLEKPVEKSVAKVKEVRVRAYCGLFPAKQALEKYDWDVEKAVTYLTKGEAYV